MFHVPTKGIIVRLTARRTKAVTCEKCQTSFSYDMTRVCEAVGMAPLHLGQKKAAKDAHSAAQDELQQLLERDAELVPCPTCDWVNTDSIAAYRRGRYRRLPLFSVALILVPLLIGMGFQEVGAVRLVSLLKSIPLAVLWPVMILWLSSPLWMLVVRGLLRRRINPNRGGGHRPEVPLGTPEALMESVNPQTGERIRTRVLRRYPMTGEREGWTFIRPGRDSFPEVCCVCLTPTTETYRPPFKYSVGLDCSVPLCKSCVPAVGRSWWRWAVVSVGGVLGATGLVVMTVPGMTALEYQVPAWAVGGFLAIVCLRVLPSAMCRPFGIHRVDASRNVYGFRATNPAYTKLLAEQVQQSGG